MKIDVKPGKYVVAVSGGVDSMVLLDLLAPHQNLGGAASNQVVEHQVFGAGLSKLPDVEVVVTHFNHGIRPDSGEDEKLVEVVARKHNLQFEVGRAQLGPDASEAVARAARYEFLEKTKTKHGANAIITAHHQDDLIETALINVLRGTGPLGLTSLISNKDVVRPLSGFNKSQIYAYAIENNLEWREDSTNTDEKYLRNYLRHNISAKLSSAQRQEILENIQKVAKNNKIQHEIIASLSHKLLNDNQIDRSEFASLPSEVANQLIAYWLRSLDFRDFDKGLINKTNIAIRTGLAGSHYPLSKGVELTLSQTTARLQKR